MALLKNLFKRNRRLKGQLETPDLIVVGLGNPEPHYLRTRHNAGWWLIDLLAEKHSIDLRRAHSTTRLGIGTIGGRTVALAKPRTHVNGSGEAVAYLLARMRATQDRLLIVYDETALPPGKLRLRPRWKRSRTQRHQVDHRRAWQPGLRKAENRRRPASFGHRQSRLGPRRNVLRRPGTR